MLCKIWLAVALCIPFISLPVSARIPTDRTVSISIKDFLRDSEPSQRLLIRSQGRTVIDKTAHNFAVVDPFSAFPNEGLEQAKLLLLDLTNDGKKSLIIRTWSGGAHCCYSYDIYSVTDNFRNIWHFNAHDGHMLTARKNQKSAPTLYIEDATFRYWDVGVPAMPVVALEWNGHTFSPVHSKKIRHLTDQDNQKASMQFLKSLNPNQRPELFGFIIKLYYSGNAEAGMKCMRMVEGARFNSEHAAFVRQLKTSPFYDDILRANKGVL